MDSRRYLDIIFFPEKRHNIFW